MLCGSHLNKRQSTPSSQMHLVLVRTSTPSSQMHLVLQMIRSGPPPLRRNLNEQNWRRQFVPTRRHGQGQTIKPRSRKQFVQTKQLGLRQTNRLGRSEERRVGE